MGRMRASRRTTAIPRRTACFSPRPWSHNGGPRSCGPFLSWRREGLGADRASWLTSLASQILTDMNPGDSREFLLLSPQGRIEYAPAAVEDGQALWLIVEGAQAEPLTDYLNRMKFMLRVDIENMSGEYAVSRLARTAREQALSIRSLRMH